MKNIAKQIALIGLLVLISMTITLLFQGRAAADNAETFVCICPDSQYVNVRNQPRSNAATWGKMHNGDTLEAEGVSNGFIEFRFNGRKAYASVRFFEREDGGQYTIDANGRVRVRSMPNGKRVGWAEPGDHVTVDAWQYDENGDLWARCGDEFISAGCLKAI